jgi:hypothetical protein
MYHGFQSNSNDAPLPVSQTTDDPLTRMVGHFTAYRDAKATCLSWVALNLNQIECNPL